MNQASQLDVRRDYKIVWSKMNWKWEVLALFEFTAFFSMILTIPFVLIKFIARGKAHPKQITDGWLTFILILQANYLWCFSSWPSGYHIFIFGFSIYLLFETVSASFRDVLLSPILHDGKIQVYSRHRWIVLSLISAVEVILNFAIIILFCRNDFQSEIPNQTIEPLTAVYISAVTFMTLGYGDFFPKGEAARAIVLFELAFFLMFFALKLPVAAGMVKVSEVGEDSDCKKKIQS